MRCSRETARQVQDYIGDHGGKKLLRKVYLRNPPSMHGDFGLFGLSLSAGLLLVRLLIAYAKTRRCKIKFKKDGSTEIDAPDANALKALLKESLKVDIRRIRKSKKRK